jgi:hypothetical protein
MAGLSPITSLRNGTVVPEHHKKHVHRHADIVTWTEFSFGNGIDVNALRISVAVNISINVKIPFTGSL